MLGRSVALLKRLVVNGVRARRRSRSVSPPASFQDHELLSNLPVYLFKEVAWICIASRYRVERLLGAGAVSSIFHGYIIYRAPYGDFLGVWGARNTSRFRRLLREAGAEITIHREPPPAARSLVFTTHPGARGRKLTREQRALIPPPRAGISGSGPV